MIHLPPLMIMVRKKSNYGDEELLDFTGLGEALLRSPFYEEEELAHKEEFNISPYKARMSSSRRPT